MTGAPQRIKKSESNKKDNVKLKQARKELNERGFSMQAKTFVSLMIEKFPGGDDAATKARMPWKSYQELSEAWCSEGHDCRLPPIAGLHMRLREIYSKMKK